MRVESSSRCGLVRFPPRFPPRERAALAQAVASRHGMGMVEAARLVSTLKVSPETVQHGIELEGRMDQALERWGLSWS